MTENQIQPINSETIHRICSGQVICSLPIAVKELVENSLDAGASIIEVRLRNFGVDSIEVSDNGRGIKEQNFEGLALKHHTSKITKFDDLENLSTFGFRGEALSSLCSLGTLIVTTRHESANVATKLTFAAEGRIQRAEVTSGSIGTRVTLTDLFATLPVRRKELLKNAKREFGKTVVLLQAYGLIGEGIKYIMTNQKGEKKDLIFSTDGRNSTCRDNILSIFGSKQHEVVEDFDEIVRVGDENIGGKLTLIASKASDLGRSASDRQFFYVNRRPIEFPPKIRKVINDTYRQFSSKRQFPFVFLNFDFFDVAGDGKKCAPKVDFNVTPDKRKIFFRGSLENAIVDCLRTILSEIFEKSNLSIFENEKITKFCLGEGEKSQNLRFENCASESEKVENIESKNLSFKQKFGSKKRTSESETRNSEKIEHFEFIDKKFESENFRCNNGSNLEKNFESKSEKFEPENSGSKNLNVMENFKSKIKKCELQNFLSKSLSLVDNFESKSEKSESENFGTKNGSKNLSLVENFESKSEKIDCENSETKSESKKRTLMSEKGENFEAKKPKIVERKRKKFDISIEAIKKKLREERRSESGKLRTELIFRTKVDDPAETCEDELRRTIDRDLFGKMEILGQFNAGFIITKLDGNLFIVDQHSSDEKFWFDFMEKNNVLEHQKLVNPYPLELSADNEELLMENLEVFSKNGFEFEVDPNAPATKKVKMTSIPISKNFVFGKDDVDEMLFMIREEPNRKTLRPSRVRSLFASRACRKSVMIGQSLEEKKMRKIIDQMMEIQQPWNCPHGRPTIRHLLNLDLLNK